MTLLMPIQPEPASRIYSGRKWYELRKSVPPTSGFVYLYETKDQTGNINAFRGGFFFRQHLNLPLDELWARVGERATSFERFTNYFGTKHKRGIAIAIERVEIFAKEVSIDELKEVDRNFNLPRWPWTYMIANDSPAVRYLDSYPRARIFTIPQHNASNVTLPAPNTLEVIPLLSSSNSQLVTELYNVFVKPNYPESEDYIRRVIEIHNSASDPYGYFTRKKKIWVFVQDGKEVGFTVVTEKRGGSIKFGPTTLKQEYRGKGLATNFRLLTESKYPNARKCYNTLPQNNLGALRYVLQAGYKIEAHLQRQYTTSTGEFVVGKLLTPKMPSERFQVTEPPLGSLQIRDAQEFSRDDFDYIIRNTLSRWYDEINAGYISGLVAGMNSNFDLSKKVKKVGFAFRSDIPVGIIVVTPKRGGALKCSPLIVESDDSQCVRELLEFAYSAFRERRSHKYYVHLPLLMSHITQTLSALGFSPEGILLEPYKPSIDILVLGKIII